MWSEVRVWWGAHTMVRSSHNMRGEVVKWESMWKGSRHAPSLRAERIGELWWVQFFKCFFFMIYNCRTIWM